MSDTNQPSVSGKAKSDSDVAALMMQLDLAAAEEPAGQSGAEQRFAYRQKCHAHIRQPGDATPIEHTVMPRNLGKTGMSFLHSGYVHANSSCGIQLITLQGSWSDVAGRVEGCRYVGQNMHEVLVRFDEPIEPTEFCRDAIRNRVLVVDDDELMTRLTKVLLEKLNADVEVAFDGAEGVEKAMKGIFDLVLMDIEMPKMDGIEATKQLRQRGYSGVIMAATAHTQPEDRQRCLEAGCDDFLPKPIMEDKLAKALESVQRRPIYSAYADDPSMVDLVSAFVAELPARIRSLEEAASAGDLDRLKDLVRALKAEGTSFGFETVTSLADTIEKSLIKEASIDDLRREIDRLVKLCLQIRSAARAEST